MIKGIKLNNGKTVNVEEIDEACDIPTPILEVIKPFNRKRIDDFYSYGVYEINNCLKRSYFDRVEGHYESIKQLFSSAFGKAVHKAFLEKFDVKEKTIKLELLINGEKIILASQPDGYDFSKKTLIDIKTVKNAESDYLPRQKDITQIQYFWSAVNEALPAMHIERLQLFYCDREGGYKVVEVDKISRIDEMKSRINILHNSLKKRLPPEEEISYACKYCPFNSKCNLEPLFIQNESIRVRGRK